jgi:hypothetical protein
MTLVGPEFQAVFDLHPGVYQVSGRSYFSNYIFGLLILSLFYSGQLGLIAFDWVHVVSVRSFKN